MQLTLKPHQIEMVNWVLSHKRCALWASMGSGKTVSVLFALSYIQMENPHPVLVIAPFRVASTVWMNEVKRWSAFSNMTVSLILGSQKQRVEAYNREASLYVINFENLPWLLAHGWKFPTVIVDESTRLKSFRFSRGGKQTKALGKVAHKNVDRFIELTGTPSPNGLNDLWGQMWFLDKGKRLGCTYSSYLSRWFIEQRVGSHSGAVKYIPKPHAQREIEAKIADRCLSLDIADYEDIDKPLYTMHKVELPVSALKAYRKFQREMFCELQGEELLAVNMASKTIKCLQLANGAFYKEGQKEWQEVHTEKIKALEAIVEKSGGNPLLVAYHFKSDLERLLKVFPKGRQLDRNPQTIIDWNKGKIPLLFAHPASSGHGLNLQYGGNILVFFSLWWNLEQHLQIIERIGPTRQKQAGFKRSVFVHTIIAQNTIDELIYKRLQTKASVQECLLEAMRKEYINV